MAAISETNRKIDKLALAIEAVQTSPPSDSSEITALQASVRNLSQRVTASATVHATPAPALQHSAPEGQAPSMAKRPLRTSLSLTGLSPQPLPISLVIAHPITQSHAGGMATPLPPPPNIPDPMKPNNGEIVNIVL